MPSRLAVSLARGELRSLALCVVVAVALLRIGASATLDSLGTAVIGLFIGGIALGSAIRRGGGARGWAVKIGGVVGAVSGALDGAIAGVAACAGLPDVHAFTGRPLACDGTPGVMVTGALLFCLVGAFSVLVGVTGTPAPSDR